MDAERGPRSAASWLAYLLGEAIAAVTVHALDMTTILLGAASIAPLEGHGMGSGRGKWKRSYTTSDNRRVSAADSQAADSGSSRRERSGQHTRQVRGVEMAIFLVSQTQILLVAPRSLKFFGGALGCAGFIAGVW